MRVTTTGAFTLRRVFYTVPSRLVGLRQGAAAVRRTTVGVRGHGATHDVCRRGHAGLGGRRGREVNYRHSATVDRRKPMEPLNLGPPRRSVCSLRRRSSTGIRSERPPWVPATGPAAEPPGAPNPAGCRLRSCRGNCATIRAGSPTGRVGWISQDCLPLDLGRVGLMPVQRAVTRRRSRDRSRATRDVGSRAGCSGEDGLILVDRFLTRSETPLNSLPERTLEQAEATLACPATWSRLARGAAVGQMPFRIRHPDSLMQVARFQPEPPL